MGMFNYVICETELPDGFRLEGGDRFQTKDLEPKVMDLYTITADGRLLIKKWEMKSTGRWFIWDLDKIGDEAKIYVDPPPAKKHGVIGLRIVRIPSFRSRRFGFWPPRGKPWAFDFGSFRLMSSKRQDFFKGPWEEEERINERWEEVTGVDGELYTGVFRFYAIGKARIVEKKSIREVDWHEYTAKFINGKLFEIKVVNK